MADLDINSIIILITLFIIFGVFLCFDIFKRNEKYGYIAYILAVIPTNYVWYLGFDALGVYVLLFALWDIYLIRDLLFIFSKHKEFDDVILFLILGIFVQLIITAILPADQLNPQMQANTAKLWLFYIPDVYTDTFSIELWVNSTILLAYRVTATLMIILSIIPLILEVRGEEIPLPGIIIVTALFIIPFLFLSFIWLPAAMGVLTFLLSVFLFIILLIITRSGREG